MKKLTGKLLNFKISPLFLIPVVLLFFVVCSVPFINAVKDKREAQKDQETQARQIMLTKSKNTLPPEKTVGELEEVYAKNHNPKTLESIIVKMKPETPDEYEKKLSYYGELFKTADALKLSKR
jgi:hypothetical protein